MQQLPLPHGEASGRSATLLVIHQTNLENKNTQAKAYGCEG